MAQWVRIHLQCRRQRRQSLGWEDPLEEEMATHSIGGIFVYKVLCVFNYLGYVSVPRSGIAGPYNSSLFKIWGNASLFSRMGLPFYLAISSAWGSWCSAFSPTLVAACPFDSGHLSGCGWISRYSFHLYFPCGQCCSASFYVLLGHWHVFFRKISVQIFDLLKLDYVSFYCWVVRVLMYSKWAQILSRVWFFATPWSVACQAPLFLGFSCQVYWSGMAFPNSGIEPASPMSPTLACRFFIASTTWEAHVL